MSKIIVFGNEKGGSGKSTAAMHVAVNLLRQGYSVATIDLDARQGTMTKYFKNRARHLAKTGQRLPTPHHIAIEQSYADTVQQRAYDHMQTMGDALIASEEFDITVIDTPGAYTDLNRLAHAKASVLVTPVNDSFVDLDVLADIDSDTHKMRDISAYAETVMITRQLYDMPWLVMRNRMSHMLDHNKAAVADILDALSATLGFQNVTGFGERVIFKELFLKGLTLMDLQDDPDHQLTLSHVAARAEVQGLCSAIMRAIGNPISAKQDDIARERLSVMGM